MIDIENVWAVVKDMLTKTYCTTKEKFVSAKIFVWFYDNYV